jgi:uncharacterized protein YoaH (UPF0181 family)
MNMLNDLLSQGMSEREAIATAKQQVKHLYENFDIEVKHTGEKMY